MEVNSEKTIASNSKFNLLLVARSETPRSTSPVVYKTWLNAAKEDKDYYLITTQARRPLYLVIGFKDLHIILTSPFL
jgi:hypothetical protein